MNKIIKTCMLATLIACPLHGVRKTGKRNWRIVRTETAQPLSPKKREKKQQTKKSANRQEPTRDEPWTCQETLVTLFAGGFFGTIGFLYLATK